MREAYEHCKEKSAALLSDIAKHCYEETAEAVGVWCLLRNEGLRMQAGSAAAPVLHAISAKVHSFHGPVNLIRETTKGI